MFLVISDSYSKWLDIMPMNSINTATLTQYLRHSSPTHGLPFIIVTDNGPPFTSNEFKAFNEKYGKHIFAAPYHPLSNEMAECSVQTLKNAMKKIIEGRQCMNLNKTTYRFLLHYQSTPQIAIGKFPAEFLFNHKINTRLNLLRNSLNRQNLI